LTRIPFYKRIPNSKSIIVLAVDGHILDDLDEVVEPYTAKGSSVVVLVGTSSYAEALLPGREPKLAPGHITAPPAWEWIRENLPQAKDCIFVP